MYNLIDRIWRCRTIWIVAVMRSKLLSNLVQPFIKLAGGAGVKRWERSNNAGLALRNN